MYLFKILETTGIDGKTAFKVVTDVELVKEMCEEYDYLLTDMPMENEKGNIDGLVKDRFTLHLEFTIDEDDINVVLTNAWRFRGTRLDKLGLTLTRSSKLQKVDTAEASADGEKKDPWVNAGKVEKKTLSSVDQRRNTTFRFYACALHHLHSRW